MKPRKYKVRSTDVWDEEVEPIIEGVIRSIEPMKVDDEERLTMTVETPTRIVRVWHSKAVDEAFELGSEGDGIRLEYRGKVPLKGGKTFKRISVAVWEGGNLDDIKAEQTTRNIEGKGTEASGAVAKG